MTIELRLSDVDPPAPDPPRTIYRDVLNLPDPVKLGLTVRYFNHDEVGLYMQITASCAGYTFGTVNLGLLGSGANLYKNLDQFGSRAKPAAGEFTAGEFEEVITLTLKGYTDSGYTNLKWTFERTVTIHWIKSDDASWTQEFLNNFDDGTVQGWAAESQGGTPTIGVATDYVLSAPYALKVTLTFASGSWTYWFGAYKSFVTPNRDKVFAIIDCHVSAESAAGGTGMAVWLLQVLRDSTLLVYLGKYTNASRLADEVPRNKWLRIVVPLPKNSTVIVRVRPTVDTYSDFSAWLWMDDFKIISK